MKHLTRILESPGFLRGFHGWCTTSWIPITVLAYFAGWLKSVIFVSVISMLALFLGSFSAWQAARTEDLQVESLHELKGLLMEIKENDTG